MEKLKSIALVILLVIFLLTLGTATKLKTARTIGVSGAVSGSANFDGSGNVTITTTQANIAVLVGTLSSDGTATISYPEGFNKNNCVPIAVMTANGTKYSAGTVFDTVSSARGGIPATLHLNDSNMSLYCKNIYLTNGNAAVVNTSGMDSFGYRIILMKIS